MKPYILTLTLDDGSFEYFNLLRKSYFPPEKNFIDAHLTLFHQLPSDHHSVIDQVDDFSKKHERITMEAVCLVRTGNGVAFKIQSDELGRLHKKMQLLWKQFLIPQDQQKLFPHVTVQNKVPSAVAHQLHQHLSGNFVPFIVEGTGFSLWEYLGGPWKHVRNFPFI